MIIGRITKVDGIKVVGTFYEKLPPHLIDKDKITPAPQINSFVKTKIGLDSIICQIVGEHEFEYDKYKSEDSNLEYTKENFMVDLEVRGRIICNEFKGGLRCLPIVGAIIETLDESSYNALFGNKEGLQIGSNLFDTSNIVYLDSNKLIPSHIGIFGNTGSGKSNTLARLLKEYVKIIPPSCNNAKILLFDLNNEYGGSSIIEEGEKNIYTLNTRIRPGSGEKNDRIPIDVANLTEDNWGTLLRATQKTQMPVVRRAFKNWKNPVEPDFIKRIKDMLINRKSMAFYTFRDNADNYFTKLDVLIFHSKNGLFYWHDSGTQKFCNAVEDCPDIELKYELSTLDKFFIELLLEISRASESGTNYEYVQPLIARARVLIKDLNKILNTDHSGKISDIFNDKIMAVIKLGNVNMGVRELIPSLMSELIFQNAIETKKGSKTEEIISIVIDEAHNLLSYDPNKNDLVHDNTIRVFERIIKEGRKFGVFLYLSSQRPSDISETITSQIHNYFIHKLVNPRDIEKIRKTVSFMGDSSLSMLSALGQGECIISGPSLYMPQYVYVSELDKKSKPNSNDLTLTGEDGIFEKRRNTHASRP